MAVCAQPETSPADENQRVLRRQTSTCLKSQVSWGPASAYIWRLGAFFSPAKAVIRVGEDKELKELIRSISRLMSQAPAGYQQMMGARTTGALALVRSRSMSYNSVDREAARKVNTARAYLAKHYREAIDMAGLASRLGLSYSRFRALFKAHTGAAPHQYQIDIRLNLARHWLVDSNMIVTKMAEELGFSSAYYFSRLFKKKVGCPPGADRKR